MENYLSYTESPARKPGGKAALVLIHRLRYIYRLRRSQVGGAQAAQVHYQLLQYYRGAHPPEFQNMPAGPVYGMDGSFDNNIIGYPSFPCFNNVILFIDGDDLRLFIIYRYGVLQPFVIMEIKRG